MQRHVPASARVRFVEGRAPYATVYETLRALRDAGCAHVAMGDEPRPPMPKQVNRWELR